MAVLVVELCLRSVPLLLLVHQLLLLLLPSNVVTLVMLKGAVLDTALDHQMGLVPGLRLARGPQRVYHGGDHEDGKGHPEDHAPLAKSTLEEGREGMRLQYCPEIVPEIIHLLLES